jgi:hypothetical protein
MTAKLGPSMIMLGGPAIKSATASNRTKPAETIAAAIDEAPLDYPFPGSKGSAGLTPAGDAEFVRVSASIIAMAEPEPWVSFEQVAAVDKDTDDNEAERRREFFGPLPTVIRGGVVDNGGSAPATVPAASSQSASSSRQPQNKPDTPPPAPPPASIVPQTKIQ